MSIRVTVILDEEVVKKLRKIQAKLLLKSRKPVSFSSVVNECLKKCI